MNDPITLPYSKTKYGVLIPSKVEVKAGNMPSITFTDDAGDMFEIMLFTSLALKLFDALGSVLVEDMTDELNEIMAAL